MALSTTVSQRKMIRRKAPLGFLKRVFKRQKPHLRLKTSSDLLVRFCPCIDWQWGSQEVHLNCLLFVHRLAEESRINACGSKCGIIKKEHVLAAAKVILKKSRG
ncbi:centromere protein W isoform X1 [Capricornis sumatraensis]|uniref:centromere protein W isoform X1 n=1 Tax=Capricornis sumatraensis TaxID=34865 RepID=UPI0036044A28